MLVWAIRTALIWLLFVAPAAAQTPGKDKLPSRADVIASVLPAVVNVQVTREPKAPPLTRSAQDLKSEMPAESASLIRFFASGFIIDKDGIIVTNRHVVEDVVSIKVTIQDGTRLPATRIGRLSLADVALLRVHPSAPLPTVTLGDSDKVRIGDTVIAIGNPLGLGGSVSVGIVSGLNRDIRETPFDDFIQTDAAINHGNSGGPLFDRRGLVIGINTAIYSPTADSGSIGIGFALPINDAKFVIDETLKYGRVRPGWLGIKMQSVTPDIARAIGLGVPRGSIVAEVDSGGPAAKAGLREGDVIMSIGDDTPTDSRALWRAIAKAPLDKPVQLTVWRDGKVLKLMPTVGEMPPTPGENAAADTMVHHVAGTSYEPGFRLSILTPAMRSKYKVEPGQNGVVVTSVDPNSPAAERGIVAGDVIVRAGENPASSPAEVQGLIASARKKNEPYLLLLVSGPGGQRFVPLPLHPEG